MIQIGSSTWPNFQCETTHSLWVLGSLVLILSLASISLCLPIIRIEGTHHHNCLLCGC